MDDYHVFISYLKENREQAKKLKISLEAVGIKAWLDRDELLPGQNWKEEIRVAITNGKHFIILFSKEYDQRNTTYLEEELNLAIDELQRRKANTSWFIPVVLDKDINIPNRRIGGGRMLNDIQRLDLSENWEENVQKLAKTIHPSDTIQPKMVSIPPDNHSKTSIHSPDYNPFWIGSYPVTQFQWEEVMGNNPSSFNGNPNHPVEHVSWDDVQEFIAKLNSKKGKLKYRLPLEAEWEYACLAGFNGKFGFDGDEKDLCNYAWYLKNSENSTHPVGHKKPNAWGLHDMHGNVCEWVSDTTKVKSHKTHSGIECISKGGSFDGDSSFCSASSQTKLTSNIRYNNLGFRLAGDINEFSS